MIRRLYIGLLLFVISSQTTAFAQTITIGSRVYEAQESDGQFLLNVTRSSAADAGAVRVGVFPYGTAVGAAEVGTANADVLPGAGVDDGLTYVDVFFVPGQSTATATIPLVNDNAPGDKTFGVVLRRSGAYGQIGLMGYGIVTVRDDEEPSIAPPLSPPGPAPQLEGNILCIFGTPYDDEMYWDRIITPALSSYALFLPTAADMLSPELIALGGEGNDCFTCIALEPTPLPVYFDGEQGTDNKIVLISDSVRDTNTATICQGEVSLISQREAGTVGGISYPAATWMAEAENVQVINVSVQVGGGFGDGMDIAFLKDSAGDDCLTTTPDATVLTGTGYESIASGFDRTVTYGSTGFDKATIKGNSGDDEFTGKPTFSRMLGDRPNPFNNGLNNTDYDTYVSGFDKVTADGCDGQDIAYLSGTNQAENYVGTATYGELTRGTNCLRAEDFDDVVVFGGGGGDKATLFDSTGDDIFVGRRENSAIFDVNRNYSHTVKTFANVCGVSDAGGNDEAQLYDTHGSDKVTAEARIATLTTPKSFTASAEGFSRVLAISNQGGNDKIEQNQGLYYFFQRLGNWN